MKKITKLTIICIILNLIYYFCMLSLLGSIVSLSTTIPEAISIFSCLIGMVVLGPYCFKIENLLLNERKKLNDKKQII